LFDRSIDHTIKEQEGGKAVVDWPGAIDRLFDRLIKQKKEQEGGEAVVDWPVAIDCLIDQSIAQ